RILKLTSTTGSKYPKINAIKTDETNKSSNRKRLLLLFVFLLKKLPVCS
ncbi:hypothetical protein HMPREF9523_02015, partial [Enterococcus faecium TX0133A]